MWIEGGNEISSSENKCKSGSVHEESPDDSNDESESAIVYFENWEEDGFPPILEGVKLEEGRPIAKKFIKAYFKKKWIRGKEERLFGRVLKEVSRLNEIYPGLRKEVFEEKIKK